MVEDDPVDILISQQLQNQVINFEEAPEDDFESVVMPKGVTPMANTFFEE